MENRFILRPIADELRGAGCRVFVWGDDRYNESWRKGDWTSVIYHHPDHKGICRISTDMFRVRYSRLCVPNDLHAGACVMFEGPALDLERTLETLDAPYPTWFGRGRKEYKSIEECLRSRIYSM